MEFCNAPIAVMTRMIENTPMVMPIIVKAARNLFAPSELKAIAIISLNCIFKNSKHEIRNPKQTGRNLKFQIQKQLFTFSNDSAEDFHQLLRFGRKTLPFWLHVVIEPKQASPPAASFASPPTVFALRHKF